MVNSATVAQTYEKFWVGIPSIPITVIQRNVPIQPFSGSSSVRPPFNQRYPNYVPSNDAIEQRVDPFYTGCDKTKTCFGYPDGCVNTQSCVVATAVNVRGEIYEFEIKSGPSASK